MHSFIKEFVFLKIFIILTITAVGCSDSNHPEDALLGKGIKYLENYDNDQAKKIFKDILTSNTNRPEPYFYLGKIATLKKDKNTALKYYKKAIALDPKYIDARIELGVIYASRRNIALAQKQADSIFAIDKNNQDVRLLLAVISYAKGETKKFENLLHDVLKTTPNSIPAAKLLSVYYLTNNKENEALTILENVNAATNGSNKTILKQIMLTYSNRKDSSSAERALLRHMDYHQGDIEYYRMVINFYGRQNQLDKAENILRSAIENDPENIAQYQLLTALYKEGYSLRRAIKEIRDVIKVKPEIAELRLILAQLYIENKQTEVAEKIYQSLINVNIESKVASSARLQLASLSFSDKDYPKAKVYIDDVLNKDPSNFSALMLRGRMAMQKKDFNQVLDTMTKIIEIQPENKRARVQKAILLEKLGRSDEALQILEVVLNMDGNELSALNLKNRILKKTAIRTDNKEL